MACERYRDALTDVAAGAPAPGAVEAHLAACEACRTELEALRQALAVADAELAGLLSAEPLPELAARIRQAVAESSAAPAGRFGWLWPTAAVAATLLVALAAWVGRAPVIPRDARRPGPEGSTVPVAETAAAQDSATVTPGSARRAVRAEVPRAGGSLGTRPVGVPRDDRGVAREDRADVLVPPGEQEALLRFATLVYRSRHAPAAFLAAGRPSGDLPEPAALAIEPLEIVPLDPAETSGT